MGYEWQKPRGSLERNSASLSARAQSAAATSLRLASQSQIERGAQAPARHTVGRRLVDPRRCHGRKARGNATGLVRRRGCSLRAAPSHGAIGQGTCTAAVQPWKSATSSTMKTTRPPTKIARCTQRCTDFGGLCVMGSSSLLIRLPGHHGVIPRLDSGGKNSSEFAVYSCCSALTSFSAMAD